MNICNKYITKGLKQSEIEKKIHRPSSPNCRRAGLLLLLVSLTSCHSPFSYLNKLKAKCPENTGWHISITCSRCRRRMEEMTNHNLSSSSCVQPHLFIYLMPCHNIEKFSSVEAAVTRLPLQMFLACAPASAAFVWVLCVWHQCQPLYSGPVPYPIHHSLTPHCAPLWESLWQMRLFANAAAISGDCSLHSSSTLSVYMHIIIALQAPLCAVLWSNRTCCVGLIVY